MALSVVSALSISLCAAPGAQGATPPTNTCGGTPNDYTTTLALLPDAPFIGTISGTNPVRTITIAPVAPNSTQIRVDVNIPDGDSRSVYGNIRVLENPFGKGTLVFPTPLDGAGSSKDVFCLAGTTRVTKILGHLEITGVKGLVNFTATRS
ncbi:hypothetical protein [Streptomyces sp. RKAG337]|uniref:hypothetical protein n=1 Tax=Streptomyces sp. RKAG337 TaxID=2893404 RepID=UPI0020335846|nr:hypothetical protein [Streptomyces sp. RKAG337]MCM2425072.1 hypothetical protein [Streptomyces sp. RKAG337]